MIFLIKANTLLLRSCEGNNRAACNRDIFLLSGIHWRQSHRNKDPFVFLSCAKDSMLYQHVFSDAQLPADHAPRVGLSVNANGDISVASSDQLSKRIPSQNTIHSRP